MDTSAGSLERAIEGYETALTIRDYEVLLSVLFAHTIKAPDARKSNKVQFSIHTVR